MTPSEHGVRSDAIDVRLVNGEDPFIQGCVSIPPHNGYHQQYRPHDLPILHHGQAISQVSDASHPRRLATSSGLEPLRGSTTLGTSIAASSMTPTAEMRGRTEYLSHTTLQDHNVPGGMYPLSPLTNDPSPLSSWNTVTYGDSGGNQMSALEIAYEQGWTSAPFGTPDLAEWSTSALQRQPLGPLAEQQTRDFDYSFYEQPSAHASTTSSSPIGHSPHRGSFVQNFSNPITVPPFSPPLSFGPTSTAPDPLPQLPLQIGLDGRPYIGVYRVSQKDSSNSRRRKRAARAIEYNGLWIDEEELLEGVTTPDGTISVHECRWEEHHSPCHLWIRGDKSCISSHIQKWHGGKPGGDKLEADCRWSTCRK
ncbi:hypothetical protein HYDPIDRAFT_119746, partial [Hydnomerulius pinastri MD-312]